MQREIKYRAFDKRTECMVDLQGFKYVGARGIQLFYKDEDGCSATCTCDKEFIELLQYTGLKDKNGKTEAFEGDILKKPHGNDKSQFGIIKAESNTCNLYIEWNFSRIFEGKRYKDTSNLPLNRIKDMIIVGNIHDNPELLTQPSTDTEQHNTAT